MSRLAVTRYARIILLSGLVLLLAACSSSGNSTGSPASSGGSAPSSAAPGAAGPSPSASAVCDDVAALRGSLQKLTSIRPSSGSADELQTAVKDVQSKLSSLTSTVGTEWSAQTSNLHSAVTKLQAAVSTLATDRNASSVSGVVTALAAVGTAARQLFAAARPGCPSPSPSPS